MPVAKSWSPDALVDMAEVVDAEQRPGQKGQREQRVDDDEGEQVDRNRQRERRLERDGTEQDERAACAVADDVERGTEARFAADRAREDAVADIADPIRRHRWRGEAAKTSQRRPPLSARPR